MKVIVYFRFLHLNRLQMLTLESEVANVQRQQISEHQYVGYVRLDELWLIDDISNFSVQQQIAEEDCDILLMPQSATDTGILTADKIVNQMLKHIDCCVSFSTSNMTFE